MGELKPANNGFLYQKTFYSPDNFDEYFEQPFEIEAHGRERGLMYAFMLRWKEIEKEMGMTI